MTKAERLELAIKRTEELRRPEIELMDKGYKEITAQAAMDPRSVAAAAKHCADATVNVPTHHLPKATHGAHLG